MFLQEGRKRNKKSTLTLQHLVADYFPMTARPVVFSSLSKQSLMNINEISMDIISKFGGASSHKWACWCHKLCVWFCRWLWQRRAQVFCDEGGFFFGCLCENLWNVIESVSREGKRRERWPCLEDWAIWSVFAQISQASVAVLLDKTVDICSPSKQTKIRVRYSSMHFWRRRFFIIHAHPSWKCQCG